MKKFSDSRAKDIETLHEKIVSAGRESDILLELGSIDKLEHVKTEHKVFVESQLNEDSTRVQEMTTPELIKFRDRIE